MSKKYISVKQVSGNWWQDKNILAELDKRYEKLESGKDKGVTIDQLTNAISQLRQKKYGK